MYMHIHAQKHAANVISYMYTNEKQKMRTFTMYVHYRFSPLTPPLHSTHHYLILYVDSLGLLLSTSLLLGLGVRLGRFSISYE